MRFPHIVAFVLYDFSGSSTRIADGAEVPALVTPFSNPDGTTKVIAGGTFIDVRNEGNWNITISKPLYYALQNAFNVPSSRSKVDIYNAVGEYNPFDVNFAGSELPKVAHNFIDSISLYDGYVVMKKSTNIADF